MGDRIQKHRVDRLENKKPAYDEAHILGVYKALKGDEAAGKFKQQ
jgi:hypothetical protein